MVFIIYYQRVIVYSVISALSVRAKRKFVILIQNFFFLHKLYEIEFVLVYLQIAIFCYCNIGRF